METETKTIEQVNKPIKQKGLRGMDYYNANKDKIAKQKKEYYMKVADRVKEYNKNYNLKRRQEEYKAKHNGTLEGFVYKTRDRIMKKD